MEVGFESLMQFTCLQELAACCAVNRTWRDIFNHDILWQQRCRSCLVKYLKTEDCKVDPKFVSPEEKASSLSPVGEWRMNFMRENHLWNNWRTGNRIEEEFPKNSFFDASYFVTNNLVLWINEMKAQLLDVSVYPFLEKGEPLKLLKGFDGHDSVLCCQRFGELKCVIIQAYVVMIYNIGSPVESVWELEHVFILYEKEKIDLSKAKDYAETYEESVMGDPSLNEMAVIGNKLVASFTGHVIHIWDMDSGQNLKEDSFLAEKYITSHCVKGAENNLPFCVVALFDRPDNVATYNYYVYSLDILNFLPFNVKFESRLPTSMLSYRMLVETCAIVNEVVAISNGKYLRIYKYKTSELLVRILANNFFQVLDNRIYFVRKNRIKAFNFASESLEILPLFKANKRVKYFEVICNKFLLVRKMDDTEQVWETQIYDKARSKLSKLTLLNSLDNIHDLGVGFKDDYFEMYLNECCSRVIVNHPNPGCYNMMIVSFW